jgi:F-type H+-transporting ATPase subunit a
MKHTQITIIMTSPLEQFEVTSYFSVDSQILGMNLSLTNFGFYSIITVFIILSYHIFSSNNLRIVPNKWSISLESSYASLQGMVKEQIGRVNETYLPFIYSLFFFILISNLIGNVPYNFAIGTSIIQSLGLSFIIFIGVTVLSLAKHKLHFFSFFVPGGTPGILVPTLVMIELTSYVARAFSLGVRLFANLVAGHTLLKILSGML